MIWLASFPRSGNTFFRNVLYEVYGIPSSTWHMEDNYPLESDYDSYPVVKTHLLPSQLVPAHPDIPKVYIVREGRDALVSMAHHRKDIVSPGSDYYLNLLEAILAFDGSFFGGWSENVRQWMKVADIVIRFEDLIQDPVREVEKLRAVMALPEPDISKLPTFDSLKFGMPKYGAGRKIVDDIKVADLAKKNFRKGVVGSWKEEMPPELEKLFWELHGHTMLELGYEPGPIGQRWYAESRKASSPYCILIEGNKTCDAHMDGIRRYTEELLYGLSAFQRRQPDKWRFDVLVEGKIIPLLQYYHTIAERREIERQQFGIVKVTGEGWERKLLKLKMLIKRILPNAVYNVLSPVYRALPFRKVLKWIRGESINERYQKAWNEAARTHQLIHLPLPQNFTFVDRVSLPTVATVHDMTHLLFPDYHEPFNVSLAERGMEFLSKKASAVIAVSHSTAKDIIEFYPDLSTRVFTIHEAANGDFFRPNQDADRWREIVSRYDIPDSSYFICLSTIEPRKNLQGVIDAFLNFCIQSNNYKIMLLICGRSGWKHELNIPEHHQHFSQIRFTGHVLDDDLPLLYQHAIALCYVAHYEGFGLPPLEAMRCGTPVIFGNNSSFPEVIGEAGVGVDSKDLQAISNAMKRLVESDALRQKLSDSAILQSNRFSWLKTTFETLNVYEKVIHDESNIGDENVSLVNNDKIEVGS